MFAATIGADFGSREGFKGGEGKAERAAVARGETSRAFATFVSFAGQPSEELSNEQENLTAEIAAAKLDRCTSRFGILGI